MEKKKPSDQKEIKYYLTFTPNIIEWFAFRFQYNLKDNNDLDLPNINT